MYMTYNIITQCKTLVKLSMSYFDENKHLLLITFYVVGFLLIFSLRLVKAHFKIVY